MPVDLTKIKLINEPTVKTLSKAEIKAIKTAEEEKDKFKPRWPAVRDKELILEAARSRRKTVKLLDGRSFSIRYSHGFWNSKHTSQLEPETYLFLSPLSNDFVPCGWFSLESLERELI